MNLPEEEFHQSLNYKKVAQRFLSYKVLYIVSALAFVFLAAVYNFISPREYQNSTTVMISEKSRSAIPSGTDIMSGMALLGGQNNIDNEIEILGSFSLLKEAIGRMDMKTSMYTYDKSFYSEYLERTKFVKKTEVYEDAPILIQVDPTSDQVTYLPFYIEFIDDNSFYIFTKDQKDPLYLYNYIDDVVTDKIEYKFFRYKYNFGQEIKTEYGNFKILKTSKFKPDYTESKVLYFYMHNTNFQAFEYQENLRVEQINPTASILKLTLRGTNYYRVTDYLNVLSSVFLDRNLQKKNNAAASTVSFIDAQISEFKDSLSTAEANLKRFRTSHKVMDLSFQGQQVFAKLDRLETERATLKEQQRYYFYLRDYFNKNKDISDLVAPSSMSVVDPILTKLVTELMTINAERVSALGGGQSSDNILLRNYDVRINNLKKTIEENVENSIATMKSSMNELDYRINKITSQISNMPKTELQLKGIERQFELNSTIYTFLLQKRSEAQITKASSMPDYEVIEPARAISPKVVAPKGTLNIAIALFLAFLFPTAFIMLKDFFNNKLMEVEEIESIAGKPVMGKVFRNFRRTNLIVAKRPNSSVAESFRSIRTNFQFFDHSGQKQVVLFTSSTSGDGKTFCSINFASVLALNGHRTVILEFDLRRPKVHQEFGASNMIGISSFLIDKAVIDDIILPTEIENLDLISAGPAAPNPAELIASERTAEFIETLKDMYDYVIIDSAPVGIVSETFLLMKHTDVNIFVVRLEKTVRDAFRNALRGLAHNGFSNFSLLINDLNIRKESYKYGYDTNYYTEDQGGFFKRLFRWFRPA